MNTPNNQKIEELLKNLQNKEKKSGFFDLPKEEKVCKNLMRLQYPEYL